MHTHNSTIKPLCLSISICYKSIRQLICKYGTVSYYVSKRRSLSLNDDYVDEIYVKMKSALWLFDIAFFDVF